MDGKDSPAVQDWKWSAIEEQQSYMELLKGRKTDVVALSQLPRVVGFAMFGPPAQLPDADNQQTGYDRVQLKDVRKVCTAILRRAKKGPDDEENPKEVRLKFVFVVTRMSRERTATYPVFHLQDVGLYVDWQARVYGSWKQFLKRNKLPCCRMCYPEGGEYTASEYGAVQVGFRRSPASSNVRLALTVVSLSVSLGSTAVSITSLVVSLPPLLLVVAAVGAIASGTYSVACSVDSLCDRSRHGKTLSLRSGDARRCWLALGAGTVGVAVSGTGVLGAKALQSGQALATRAGLAALTATSATAGGLSLANCAVDLMKKMWAGQALTALDAFQIASFLLFFTGTALSSAQAASRLRSVRPADGKTSGSAKQKPEPQDTSHDVESKTREDPEPQDTCHHVESKTREDPEPQDTSHDVDSKPRRDGYVRVDKQQLRNNTSIVDSKTEEATGDEVDAMLRLLREEGKSKHYVVDDDADMSTFWKRIGTVILVSSLVTIVVIVRTLLAQ